MTESGVSLSSLDVKSIFIENKIVPSVLPVAPKKALNISYPNGIVVNFGNEIKPSQTIEKPQVKWEAEKNTFYSLLMFDPDAGPAFNKVRHWLVMNIPESEVESGDEVIAYMGSATPKSVGLIRYITLVYKQPHGKINHNESRSLKWSQGNRLKTSTSDFVQKYNLGDPEFGNFYRAQYEYPYVDNFYAQLTD